MTEDETGQTQEEENLPVLPADRSWPRPWMAPFLRSLSLLPDVSSACRIARIARSAAYANREKTPGFADAWDEALELAQDFVLRQAHTWVTTGVPVRSTRTVTKRKLNQAGEILETITETTESESAERSATMMIFWLKAFHPERFRWSERAEVTGAEGGPIRIETLSVIDAQIAKLAAELGDRAGLEPIPDEA